MNAKELLLDVLKTGVVTFLVTAVVTWVYSLIAHGAGTVDWATAVRLAVILGIVLPVTRRGGGVRRTE